MGINANRSAEKRCIVMVRKTALLLTLPMLSISVIYRYSIAFRTKSFRYLYRICECRFFVKSVSFLKTDWFPLLEALNHIPASWKKSLNGKYHQQLLFIDIPPTKYHQQFEIAVYWCHVYAITLFCQFSYFSCLRVVHSSETACNLNCIFVISDF